MLDKNFKIVSLLYVYVLYTWLDGLRNLVYVVKVIFNVNAHTYAYMWQSW